MSLMIKRFALALVANSVALYAIDYFVVDFCFLTETTDTCPAEVTGGVLAFILGGFLLGLLNFFVKPILKLFSMPITFLTVGLFMFVVNAAILWLLVWLVGALNLTGLNIIVAGEPVWLTYLYAAVVLGLFNLLTHWLVKHH